jgi:phage terminase small subunit
MATAKELVWLNEYLVCWNATEAARRAGYKWPNKVGPAKLEKFREEIQQRVSEKAMGADEVLVRLAEQARCEYADYITAEGTVDLERLKADGKMHLVKGIKETRAGKVVEFYDGQTALMHLGKHHGLFVDKLGLDIKGDISVVIGGVKPGGI